MKWTAGVALGASFFLGACATSAMGDEVVVHSDDGERRVVRMVVDEIHDGDEHTRMCVFVPAGGEEAAGALSCSGADFRVVELDEGGNVFFSGDTVISEGEINELVRERLAEINERIAEHGDLRIEFQDFRIDSAEFAAEMEELAREMENLHIEITSEHVEEQEELAEEMAELAREMEALRAQGHDEDSEEYREREEELEELAEEMAELSRELHFTRREVWVEHQSELAELQGEMASMRAEAMAEVAAEMARLEAEGVLVRSHGPGTSWVAAHGTDHHFTRQTTYEGADGQIVSVEHVSGDDGGPRVIVRTTDPSLVEVIQMDADEFDRLHEDDD